MINQLLEWTAFYGLMSIITFSITQILCILIICHTWIKVTKINKQK